MKRKLKATNSQPWASEKEVLKACLDLLELYPSIRAWRQNCGAIQVDKRFIRFGLPGMADITGIISEQTTIPCLEGYDSYTETGKRLEIECKSVTGRQSESQRAFETMITSRGGIYMLVRSPDELQAELEKLGLKPGRGR